MAAILQILALFLVMLWQTNALEVDVSGFKLMASTHGDVSLKTGSHHLVKVKVDSIIEKDKDGKEVPGNASINPHKIMPKMYMVPSKAMFKNASMPHHYSFQMKSNLMLKEANATLEVDVLFATNNGTVDGIPSTKKFHAMKHSVLVGITVKSWPFCRKAGIKSCMHNNTEVHGKYLDVTLKVENADFRKENTSWVSKSSETEVMLTFSDKVKMDSDAAKMIAHYPKVGNKMIVIRFEKFNTAGMYKYMHFYGKQTGTSGCSKIIGTGLLTITTSVLVYLLGFLS